VIEAVNLRNTAALAVRLERATLTPSDHVRLNNVPLRSLRALGLESAPPRKRPDAHQK
jgi:hypothetical protein